MRTLISCSVLFLVGCSKTSGPLDERISSRLLEGNKVSVYLDDEELGVNISVLWSRPGFEKNMCTFNAQKKGDELTVNCGPKGEQGQFRFSKGKLTSEQANAAPEAHWAFIQDRAREISKALYSLR